MFSKETLCNGEVKRTFEKHELHFKKDNCVLIKATLCNSEKEHFKNINLIFFFFFKCVLIKATLSNGEVKRTFRKRQPHFKKERKLCVN